MSDSTHNGDAQVWYWPGRLFSAEDLRRHWQAQRELVLAPRTLLTPLALDELRARGVRVTRQDPAARPVNAGEARPECKRANGWSYLQEKPDPLVAAAVAALEREGTALTALSAAGADRAAWLRHLRDWISHNAGSVLFHADALLTCCLANKVTGLRAAVVVNGWQAGRALTALGANVLIVAMPGRTFFEIRQILAMAAGAGVPACPPTIAELLRELKTMRIAEVIGTVTLSRWHPALTGYRWIIGVPLSLGALRANRAGDGEDIIILDQLGAGCGQQVGVSEGGEAAVPFTPEKKPVDAYCACLLDSIDVT